MNTNAENKLKKRASNDGMVSFVWRMKELEYSGHLISAIICFLTSVVDKEMTVMEQCTHML